MEFDNLDFSSVIGRKEYREDFISPTPAKAMGAIFDKRTPNLAESGLPPLWHWFYFWSLTMQSELDSDGHEKLGKFLPQVPLPRRMYAGGGCEFPRAIRIGSEALKESTISRVEFKRGSSGPLFFVTVEHRIIQDGIVSCIETQNIVYRDRPKSELSISPISPDEVRSGPGEIMFETVEPPTFSNAWFRNGTINAESPLLFRFSALTYNAHKIHYDPFWAIGEEGYDQLVVHGPLIAISLLESLRGDFDWPSVKSFSFRSQSPAFVGETILLKADKYENSGTVMLSASVESRLIMSAVAVMDF